MVRIAKARLSIVLVSLWYLSCLPVQAGKEGDDGVKVDKDKNTITIDARIAPRKLPHLKGEVYPIEVIACFAHPKGKKALRP